MKTSDVFYTAKKFVTHSPNNYWRRYICCAIDDSGVPRSDAKRAKQIIQQRLGRGCNSLEDWMHKQGIAPIYRDLTKTHRTKMQRARHAWLKSLIAEFEAKGD